MGEAWISALAERLLVVLLSWENLLKLRKQHCGMGCGLATLSSADLALINSSSTEPNSTL